MLPEIVMTYKRQLDSALTEIKRVTADRDQKADAIRVLEGLVSELRQNNKRYAQLNRDLNVRAQGIRTVTVSEKASSGKRGQAEGIKIHHRKEACRHRQGGDCGTAASALTAATTGFQGWLTGTPGSSNA